MGEKAREYLNVGITQAETRHERIMQGRGYFKGIYKEICVMGNDASGNVAWGIMLEDI